ncbi:cell wall-binding repeat-containing protein [Arthrobacter halodurans]|uniref:Cell wall-binding repeat-containing protein n=1 Tax=Arthrobacter halodurans TaxID=516699 RepID=A0ABV4UMT5_9MICC
MPSRLESPRTRSARGIASLFLAAALAIGLTVPAAPPAAATPQPAAPATGEPQGTAPATGDATRTTPPSPHTESDASLAADTADALRSELDAPGDIAPRERIELAELAFEALGRGTGDAEMGQGLKRIEETGDPQAPTVAELEELAAAASAAAGQTADPAAPAPRATARTASLRAAALPAAHPQEALRAWTPPGVLGVDVASHQGVVDWNHAWDEGVRFAYVKATQSWPTSYAGLYRNPEFSRQYGGAGDRGMLRGAYHFAMPAHSSGRTQAIEFMDNGGGWTNDGDTLPPLLDIEWNPYTATTYPEGKGDMCFGLTPAQTVAWIKDFGAAVKERTGRLPMIYTAQAWWDECTGDSSAFKGWALHVALYPTATNVPRNPRELPEGWTTFNVWQYTSYADFIGDAQQVDGNVWNGDLQSLRDFAANQRSTAHRLTTSYLGAFTNLSGDWITRLAPVRRAGDDRYATAIALSRATFGSSAPAVVVASGEDFPDALSGSSLAVAAEGPLLLTRRDGVSPEVLAEIARLAPRRIYVLGSRRALGAGVESALAALAPVTRLQGKNRYETSAAIAGSWDAAGSAFIATGADYPDALSLAAVAAGKRQPLLLTRHDAVPRETLAALKRLAPRYVVVAGSDAVVSDAVVAQIRAAVPGVSVSRRAGGDRYGTSAAVADAYWPDGSQRQLFATGRNFPDGLTGAVAAAYNGAPLLLTRRECMPTPVASALGRLDGWTNVLLGSSDVIASTGVYAAGGRPAVCP